MRTGLYLCLLIPLVNASVASADLPAWAPIGPEGGPIKALAIDPEHPDTVYAAGDGNVFRRIGTGDWQPLEPRNVLSIAFAGAGVIYLGGYSSWKSIDAGTSWQRLSTLESHAVLAVAADPFDANRVYALAQDAFLVSTDGGATWDSPSPGLPTLAEYAPHTLLVDPLAADTLYVTDPQLGIYRSTDGGALWAPSNSGLPCPSFAGEAFCISSLTVSVDQPETLYAGTYSNAVFRSTDGGKSWGVSGNDLGGSTITALSADPSTPSRVYAATVDVGPLSSTTPTFTLYRSDDRGNTWQAADSGLPNGEIGALAISPSSGMVYAGTARDYFEATGAVGGVYITADAGASWNAASSGLRASCVISLAAAVTTPTSLIAGLSVDALSVTLTENGGATWTVGQVNPNDSYIDRLIPDPSDPQTVYARSQRELLKTTNGGRSWSSPGDPGGAIKDLAIDPLDPQTLYAATDKVLKSSDGGATWTVVLNAASTRGQIGAVAVDPVDAAVFVTCDGAVFRSGDGGSHWKEVSIEPPLGIVQVAVVDTVPATLIATDFGERLHISRDGGHSWSEAPIIVDGQRVGVTQLVVAPSSSHTAYASTSVSDGSQVFRSDDSGRTWQPIGDVLAGFAQPFTLTVDPNDPLRLYAGTCGGGVFELSQAARTSSGVSSGGGGCAVAPGNASASAVSGLAVAISALVARRRRTLTPPASTH